MKIYIGQIYPEQGVNYPFSAYFQRWLAQEITKRVQPSEQFLSVYGDNYDLIFRLSAKSRIEVPEIKGPTNFKRSKNVEYTVFLPCGHESQNRTDCYHAMSLLMDCIVDVLKRYCIDTTKIVNDHILLLVEMDVDPAMILPQVNHSFQN